MRRPGGPGVAAGAIAAAGRAGRRFDLILAGSSGVLHSSGQFGVLLARAGRRGGGDQVTDAGVRSDRQTAVLTRALDVASGSASKRTCPWWRRWRSPEGLEPRRRSFPRRPSCGSDGSHSRFGRWPTWRSLGTGAGRRWESEGRWLSGPSVRAGIRSLPPDAALPASSASSSSYRDRCSVAKGRVVAEAGSGRSRRDLRYSAGRGMAGPPPAGGRRRLRRPEGRTRPPAVIPLSTACALRCGSTLRSTARGG